MAKRTTEAGAPSSSKQSRGRHTAIESMTGVGSSLVRFPGGSLRVELRSVNARFLDLSIRMPSSLGGALEAQVRQSLETALRRGRVDCFVTIEGNAATSTEVQFNGELFSQVLRTLKSSRALRGRIEEDELIEILLSRRELFDLVPGQTSNASVALTRHVERGLSGACRELIAMRRREGERLKADLERLVLHLRQIGAQLRKMLVNVREDVRSQVANRIKEWGISASKLDATRIEQEIALLLSRGDVHEELVRLDSHASEVLETLRKGGDVGKRLDFLAQELLRELNTIGSKVSRAPAQHLVVDGKGLVEKFKEQVQNLV